MPLEAPDVTLCWVFVYLYNAFVLLFLGGQNLEAGAAVEGDKEKNGQRGI